MCLPRKRGSGARTQRRVVVSKYCTKCIQLGILTINIIIRHEESVGSVTASLSSLRFHPLFSFLFYMGDLRYGFYVKYSVFYYLYKVLVKCIMCPIMFLLLGKNGSILE